MNNQQIQDAIEEYRDAQSLEEIELLDEANREEGIFEGEVADASADARQAFADYDEAEAAAAKTEDAPPATPEAKIEEIARVQAEMRAQMLAFIAEATKASASKMGSKRADKLWKLVSTDVSWTTKPQVRALMAIINAHWKVGTVVAESKIVAAIVENEALLNTRQGGRKIWDYYKGNTADGFLEHGNFVQV
jgi:hypothetical protein